MSSSTMLAMFEYLVFDRHMDTDEAWCIIGDVEDQANNAEEAWDILEEIL